MLISTKPKTAAEAAIIARSRQLTDFKWTPVRDVPTYIMGKGYTVLEAGVEVTGFPYASTERTDKFITENVSFETFLSVIPNPHSKLYEPGHAAFNACNYGIVCNGLARYAFGIKRRISTARWHTIPGMREIKPKGEYTVDEMQLCDVLYAFGEGRNHVALITDILRNEDGEIKEVEVSEAVRPSCERRRFTPEEYYEKYKLFALWRYDYIEEVPPFDAESDRLIFESKIGTERPRITVDNGNKSNYSVGDEVIISVFSDSADRILIYRDGELIEDVPCEKTCFMPRVFERGYYTVKLKEKGNYAEFCVTAPEISFEVRNGQITVKADAMDEKSKILYMDFRQKSKNNKLWASLEKYEELTEDEKASGIITRNIPEGGENIKVYFENDYGVWTHQMIKIIEN